MDAMKGAHKALKTEVKKVKIDEIEVDLDVYVVYVCMGWVERGSLVPSQAVTKSM